MSREIQEFEKVKVLDFGGSLGSTYTQHEKFFKSLPLELKWTVVEQKAFVAVGEEIFKDHEYLNFEQELEKNLTDSRIFFVSSTLQYLENPYEILNKVVSSQIEYIVFDRLSLHSGEEDILTIQHVSKKINRSIYPCTFFSMTKLEKFMNNAGYHLEKRCESDVRLVVDMDGIRSFDYFYIWKRS